MTFKLKCFWSNKYILFVVVALIICCTYLIIRENYSLKLEEQDYVLIENQVGYYNFSTDSSERISRFINYINTNRFRKTSKWVDVLKSPEFILSLKKKDGTVETMEIYAGAWDAGLYILYNDNQYKIVNAGKFCESIENIFLK